MSAGPTKRISSDLRKAVEVAKRVNANWRAEYGDAFLWYSDQAYALCRADDFEKPKAPLA